MHELKLHRPGAIDRGGLVVRNFAEQVSFFTCLLVAVHLLAQLRFRLSVLAAVVGPLAFIGSLIGVGSTLTEFSIPGLLMSLVGAIVLLGIANLIQRGRVR